MKLIGAAVGRTGTISLNVALKKLGYRTYHFEEALTRFEEGHLDMLDDHTTGKRKIDWKEFLEGYDATLDTAFALHYKELMEVFPEAKVVLTVRDPVKWYHSAMAILEQHEITVAPFTFLPRFESLMRTVLNAVNAFTGGATTMEGIIARFEEYIEDAKAHVPPERLLVYSVKEGWEPLCEFLGEPVPDEPFPHENVGMKLIEEIHVGHLMRDLQTASQQSEDPELQQKAIATLEEMAKQAPPSE
jgi:hypothetical protein